MSVVLISSNGLPLYLKKDILGHAALVTIRAAVTFQFKYVSLPVNSQYCRAHAFIGRVICSESLSLLSPAGCVTDKGKFRSDLLGMVQYN